MFSSLLVLAEVYHIKFLTDLFEKLHPLLPLFETLSPSTIADLFVTFPISVLSVIFFKMKAPWLQLSSSAYIFTVIPVFPYCNLTGTTIIMMISVPVFTNAHLAPP